MECGLILIFKMFTLGNYSGDLIHQDISKCVSGYLPNFRD